MFRKLFVWLLEATCLKRFNPVQKKNLNLFQKEYFNRLNLAEVQALVLNMSVAELNLFL